MTRALTEQLCRDSGETYFQIEKEIYEQLLSNPDEEVKGTVKELAEKYGQEVLTMVGFLDGIDEAKAEKNQIRLRQWMRIQL